MFLNWSLLLYVVELEGFYQLPWHPAAQTIIRDDKWLFQSINLFHLLHLSLFLCKTPETCAAPLPAQKMTKLLINWSKGAAISYYRVPLNLRLKSWAYISLNSPWKTFTVCGAVLSLDDIKWDTQNAEAALKNCELV